MSDNLFFDYVRGRKLAPFERRVWRLLLIDLEQHQFDPILSFTYSLGVGVLQASTLRLAGDI
jgi:GH24 family phage-related lysozyme (muramidase)